MRSLLLLCSFSLSFVANIAQAAGAHEHGSAKLDIAFDGLKGVLHFESPAESIYGFEHEAKSAKDIAKRDSKLEVLKTKFAEMVVFDAKAECSIANTKAEVVKEEPVAAATATAAPKKGHKHHHSKHSGEHSEVHAEFAVTCKNPVSGTRVNFAFKKHFPAVKKVVVQAINGDKQDGSTIQNDKGSVGL